MELVRYEPPKELTPKNVIYWCPEAGELRGDVRDKAMRLVRLDLVEETPWGFNVLPIPGYNKTTYSIVDSQCNCQGFKKSGSCSHTLAVQYYLKIKDWNNKEV